MSEIPAHIALIRDFVNTADLEDGTDTIAMPDGLSGWLTEHGLAPAAAGRTDVARAR